MGIGLLPQNILENYEIHEWRHACAILKYDFPEEWNNLLALLNSFKRKKVGSLRREEENLLFLTLLIVFCTIWAGKRSSSGLPLLLMITL